MPVGKRLVSRLLPEGSRRRTEAGRWLRRVKPPGAGSSEDITYSRWVRLIEPAQYSDSETALRRRPLITIVVPCYNTPKGYVKQLLSSVIGQRYDHWELCLADASSDARLKRYLQNRSRRDSRIRHISIEQNLGIAGNTNVGIQHAKGDYVGFLDHDDLLSPHALSEVARVLNEQPETDLVYTDEDKVSSDGHERREPFFKPDWEPELLLGVNYMAHFVVARKSLVDQIGGLREGFDGAQDYDFLLRLTEKTSHISHIPKVLYHWRSATGSTALDIGEKSFADSAGRRALSDAMQRRGVRAEVIPIPDRAANYRVKYSLPDRAPRVSIVITSGDEGAMADRCADVIRERSTYSNYETIIAELRNAGRREAEGEYLIFLDAGTEVVTPDWIEELVGVASQPGVGTVAPLLRYPDGRVWHAGTVLGMTGIAGQVFRLREPGEWTPFGMAAWPRNYLAVSASCLVISASRFDQVGGFDEQLSPAAGGIALGIRLHEAGYRNVHWPFAELTHHARGDLRGDDAEHQDDGRLLSYCERYLQNGDPYFNPNLDLSDEQVGLEG